MQNQKVSFKEIVLDLIKGYLDNDLANLACQVSFRFILGLFPFLLFIITVLTTISIDMTLLSPNVDALPDFTVQLLQLFVSDITKTGTPVALISTTFIFAIYSASKAFKTVIEAVNKIYFGEVRLPLIRRYILSIAFVFLFFFLVILPLFYYVFADAIWGLINLLFPVDIEPLSITNSILLFVCMFVYLTILVMLMYGMSLGKNVRLRSTITGALFCVVSWWLSTFAFNIYVTQFSNYSKIYGSIGTIIIFLLWINIITLVLMVGALINKQLYVYKQEDRSVFKRNI